MRTRSTTTPYSRDDLDERTCRQARADAMRDLVRWEFAHIFEVALYAHSK